MAIPLKYQTKEVLNKVLNTAETALQVDIVSGSEYAEDSAHTDADTGNFILGVRNDTLAALGGTDGDYVPFQMNSSGALYVEIATGGSSDAVHVDDAAFTLGSHKGMMMMGFAGTQSVDADDAGAIAMETDGSVHIHDGGNTITVDGTVTANLSATDNAVLDNILTKNTEIDAVLDTMDADTGAIKTAVEIIDNAISGSEMQVDVVASLPAGSAAIGKLAANSGVDIGDVDVTSLPASTNTLEVVGDAAEDAAAAGNPLLAGGRYDDPGNDNSTVRSLDDNDVGALALDPTGALYVREHLGQAGSCFVSGTSAVTAAIGKFVAIQFLEDTVFNGTDGLVATDSGRWPDDTDAAVDISGSNTAAVGSQVFPQGMTIFGRWDSFKLVSGAVIAYVGNV